MNDKNGKIEGMLLDQGQRDLLEIAALIAPLTVDVKPSRRFRASLRRRLLHGSKLELLATPLIWPLEAA